MFRNAYAVNFLLKVNMPDIAINYWNYRCSLINHFGQFSKTVVLMFDFQLTLVPPLEWSSHCANEQGSSELRSKIQQEYRVSALPDVLPNPRPECLADHSNFSVELEKRRSLVLTGKHLRKSAFLNKAN